MVSQLAKFLPDFADIINSLHELLLKKILFHCRTVQQKAFKKIQNLLTHLPVLSYYNPNHETLVAADSSLYGLGAVLMQRIKVKLKPINYTSRSLTATEQRYGLIKKL